MDDLTYSDEHRTLGKLAAALAKAQGEIKNAKKDSSNPFFKSNYADLASVWDSCREALSKNELAVIQAPCMIGDRLCIRTKLVHSSGEWEEGILPVAVPITAKAQEMGSAITYARRYSLQSMVGVAPDDGMDDDGNKATHGTNGKITPPPVVAAPTPPQEPEVLPSEDMPPTMSTAQRNKLWFMIKAAGLTEDEGKDLFAFVGATTKKAASSFIETFPQALADWRKATGSKTTDLPSDAPDEDIKF